MVFMKKLFLMLALGVSLCANSQLTVFENGLVRVGNYSSVNAFDSASLDISNRASSTSPITGTITFGSGPNATITGGSNSGSLSLYAGHTLSLGVGNNKNILSLMYVNQNITSLYSVKAPAFLTTSDARLKTNVESLNDSFRMLMDVNSISYNLTSDVKPDDMSSKSSIQDAIDSAAETTFNDDRTHFGFIAQEIQEIFPNLVVEDEDGMLAIDYTGFIPLLVEAYKDLSKKVKEQEEIIVGMSNYSGPHYMPASVGEVIEQKASLKQNKPNPFNTSTTIECTVPESAASAFICVYDLQGTQVMRLDINERGIVNSVIDASSLRQGMYIYSLIVDGTEVDSKRMIITD